MKFITEDDLRDQYKKQALVDFQLPPDTRLTPGARQFLIDRGVNLYEKSALPQQSAGENKGAATILEVAGRLECLEAEAWLMANELLALDFQLSQGVAEMAEHLQSIMESRQNNQELPHTCQKECTGIKAHDFAKDNGICFPITREHMMKAGGRRILLLHKLRSAIALVAKEVETKDNSLAQHLWEMVNNLSQSICSANGNTACSRMPSQQ